MKKLTAVILTLCLLLGLVPTSAFAEGDTDGDFPSGEFRVLGEPDASDGDAYAAWKAAEYGDLQASLSSDGDTTIDNQYLDVCVHSNGQFTMGTTGGDPERDTDNYKLLLFGHPYAYTSETVIRIDGVDYRFHGSSAVSTKKDGHIETVRTIAGVEITQIITLVTNPQTGREDIAQIRYECVNNSSNAKEIGVRIMLDTMLGSNDGAPFRVGTQKFKTEKEYTGPDVPRNWFCFDDFNDPTVISVGTLYNRESERPDKVQFASWGDIIGSSWNYRVNESYEMYDTAVAVYFDEKTVASGDSKSVVTYYGISENVPKPGILSMQVNRPALLNDAGNGDYDSNPFEVTAYLKNEGDTSLANVQISLNLPDGGPLALVEGESKTKSIGSLAAGEESAAQWTVRATPQQDETTVEYNVTGTYTGQSEPSVLDLETKLAKIPIIHTVTFKAEGFDDTVIEVSDGATLKKADFPPVPEKAGYQGAWDTYEDLGPIKDDIIVNAEYVALVQSVALDETNVKLQILSAEERESKQLTATVLPADAPDRSVEWVSYNESVATVDQSGLVKAVAVGTATIEAKSKADPAKSAACLVTVEAVLYGIQVTAPDGWTVKKGSPLDISALEVRAIYSDGTDAIVTDYTLTGYNPNPEGLGEEVVDDEGVTAFSEYVDEKLTIEYKGETATCTVRVEDLDPTLAQIIIRRTPNDRLNYQIGQKLNLAGMVVDIINTHNDPPETVEFTNGQVPAGFTVTGYDPSRVGNQALTLSYSEGGIVSSMQFYIRVMRGTVEPPNNVLQPRVSLTSGLGKKIVTLSNPEAISAKDANAESAQTAASNLPANGKIYYTTNGSVPQPNPNMEYTGPFTVTQTTTVKAITVVNGVKSPVTSHQVYLPQVAQPIVANVHHKNNQGLNRSTTKLEPGTLVSLLSDTAGASIYYWIEGYEGGSAETAKYGTSIYLKPEYADPMTHEVTIKAYATKDGYQNSAVAKFTYELNIPDDIPETAMISVGRVQSRSGEKTATALSIEATSSAAVPPTIKNFSVKIQYDSGALAFTSVSSLVEGAQVFYANDPGGTSRLGVVTLQYNGETALELGHVCDLNFDVLDSSENGAYALTLLQTAVSVNFEYADGQPRAFSYDFMDGLISLVGSHNSQLSAATSIVDANGDPISSAAALASLSSGDDESVFTANVTIALPEGTADAVSLNDGEDNSLKVLNVFLVMYDENGAMLNLESWDMDVTDATNLQSVRRITIPKGAKSFRFMIMSEDMTPAVTANSL